MGRLAVPVAWSSSPAASHDDGRSFFVQFEESWPGAQRTFGNSLRLRMDTPKTDHVRVGEGQWGLRSRNSSAKLRWPIEVRSAR